MAQPKNPNDGTLLSSVFICADEQAYEKAGEVLETLGLPNPEDHEHFSGPNVDRIYLDAQGIVLSFVYRHPTLTSLFSKLIGRDRPLSAPVFDARTVVDERILQPLYQIDLSPECCLEVVPGVHSVGVEQDKLRSISRELKAKNVHFYNPQREFVGVIKTPEDQDDLLVVSNRRALSVTSQPQATGQAVGQDRVYGTLREQMAEAFGSASAARKMMDECAKIVALREDDPARVLNPHWRDTSIDSYRRRTIREASHYYHRRITQ